MARQVPQSATGALAYVIGLFARSYRGVRNSPGGRRAPAGPGRDAALRGAGSGRAVGDIRPAATCVVTGLIKPEMKIEIEVTALRKA